MEEKCQLHSDSINTHLLDIKASLERLHNKVDGHGERIASHETSISFFKAGFGTIATILVATLTYMFRSS